MRRAVLLLALLLAACGVRAQQEDPLWALLKEGGQVVLMRHGATNPGVGDPPGMRLEDCATQRNLSEDGRREAAQAGAALREKGILVSQVISSPWCRCIETAKLAFRREPLTHPALGNLYGHADKEKEQMQALRKLVVRPRKGNLFLVTHGITAYGLAGVL